MFTIETIKMIAALSKSLPTEFTNSQYRDGFRKLTGRKYCAISPSIDTLRRYGLAVKVREENIPITEIYEEYFYPDGFTINCDAYWELTYPERKEIEYAHGVSRDWRERPDLPPVKICDGKRYYYQFDLDRLRNATREIIEAIEGLGL